MCDKISTVDLAIIENLSNSLIEILNDRNIASKFEPKLIGKNFYIVFRSYVDENMFSLRIDSKFNSIFLNIMSTFDYSTAKIIADSIGVAGDKCLSNLGDVLIC